MSDLFRTRLKSVRWTAGLLTNLSFLTIIGCGCWYVLREAAAEKAKTQTAGSGAGGVVPGGVVPGGVVPGGVVPGG